MPKVSVSDALFLAVLSEQLEAPSLILGTNFRLADALVQARATPPGTARGEPVASKITLRTPYTSNQTCQSAVPAAGETVFADEGRLRTFERAIRAKLYHSDMGAMSNLSFDFFPLAIDTFVTLVKE